MSHTVIKISDLEFKLNKKKNYFIVPNYEQIYQLIVQASKHILKRK